MERTSTNCDEPRRPNAETDVETDFIKIAGLNMNSYASKKTLAQGIFCLELLSANTSQLKYILSVGESHDFYYLILNFLIVSMCIQVIHTVICVRLGLMLNINKTANGFNNTSLTITIFIVAVNVLITVFDMKESH